MKILGIVFRIFKELYNAVGPDIKKKKAISLKESLSNQYLYWAPKLRADEVLLIDVVSAFLFLWFLCLILILTALRPLISEKHLLYVVISSDGAFIFYVLFFGRWTVKQLKKDLIRISRSYLKFFAIGFVMFNILFFLLTGFYANSVPPTEQIINSYFKFVSIFAGIYIGLTFIFRLLPFLLFFSSVTIVKFSITQSLKQESNQLGHFLRYVSWPALIISLFQFALLFS